MKGHEESQRIWNVAKDEELEEENIKALEEAFAETENPLGFYFAGKLCYWRKRFDYMKKSSDGDRWSRDYCDYMKKSSDGGCSWGQVKYAEYLDPENPREFVVADAKMYVELNEKAAAQNNHRAFYFIGHSNFWHGESREKLVAYRMAAELGWRYAKRRLSRMFYYGQEVKKDLVQAVYWDSEEVFRSFWQTLKDATKAWNEQAIDNLGCDFNRLAMEIGKGLYWYQYETEDWHDLDGEEKESGIKCLDYYCKTIELQQEAIFLCLLFWNQTTGVKGPGRMIGQMVWEGRYDYLVKEFGDEEESEEER